MINCNNIKMKFIFIISQKHFLCQNHNFAGKAIQKNKDFD